MNKIIPCTLVLLALAQRDAQAVEQHTQSLCPEETGWIEVERMQMKLKCIHELGARALITQFMKGGALMYSVVRPCPDLTRTYTFFWTPGTRDMRGKNCAGAVTTEPVAPWLPYFEDASVRFI